MHFLASELFNAQRIEREILRIHEKHRPQGKDLLLKEEGLELAHIAQHAKEYAKIFARDLKKGTYKILPARLVEIEVAGTKRTLYLFSLNDNILHGVISDIIHTHCQKNFSPNLKSYLKGKSHWQTIKEFEGFIRSYHKDPKVPLTQKGLYLLRRDIASYTDKIPVDNQSLLWPLLKTEIKFPENPNQLEARAWSYAQQVIQTEAVCPIRGVFRKEIGVPTGSPISTTLFNIYMVELDRTLDALSPAFYTRYGDDILVADPNRTLIETASELIQTILAKYSLQSNLKKMEAYFFNNAGRHPNPNGEPCQDFPGRDRILFLGCHIKANGTISLSTKAKNQLIDDLNKRFHKVRNLPIEEKLSSLCQMVKHTLDPSQPLCHKTALLLRYNINDRSCLNELDKRISLQILKALTGSTSPKGFRTFPLAKMREKGLPSLVHWRNQV